MKISKVENSRRIFICLLVVFQLFLLSYSHVKGQEYHDITPFKIDSWTTIDNFSDFVQRKDIESIDSMNTDNAISFTKVDHENSGTDEYVLILDYACLDFNINITMEYEIEGSYIYGSLVKSSLSLASFYEYGELSSSSTEYQMVLMSLDFSAYPFFQLATFTTSSPDIIETTNGTIDYIGNVNYILNRTNAQLTYLIIQNNQILLQRNFTDTINNHLNEIVINLFTNKFDDQITVRYTEIKADLEFTSVNFSNTNWTFSIAQPQPILYVLICLSIYYIRKRIIDRKNE